MKKIRFLAATALVGACALTGVQASWADSNMASLVQGDTYVALGSSFAAGGAAPIDDVSCGRSSNNYPHIVAREFGLDLRDVSCSGATVNNILDTPQRATRGDLRPPQLEAVGPETRLVTITAGGNDINYISTLYSYSCAADRTVVEALPIADTAVKARIIAGMCAPVDRTANQLALNGITRKLEGLISAVKQRAPHAKVVIVDYASILPQSGQGCGTVPLSADQNKYLLSMARELQLATKHAAQRSGADLVEFSKYSRLHNACSDQPWVTGWEFGDVNNGGTGAFHPNTAGVEAAAELLISHLEGSGLAKKSN
jgi:lysophospholipase L1-like esterase